MSRTATAPVRSRLLIGVIPLGALVVAAAVGLLAPTNQSAALAMVALVLALALVAASPQAFAVICVPGVFLIQRAGGGGGVSLSDLVMAVAAITAVLAPSLAQARHRLRPLMIPLLVYLAALSVAALAHPGAGALLEILHRLELVGGAMVVGLWLVESGRATVALRLLLALACVFAAAAVLTTLAHGLSPAYPLGYHKNFAGSIFSTLLIVVVCAPSVFMLPDRVRVACLVLLGAGLAATQSRAAALAAAIGILIWLVRTRRSGKGTRGRGIVVILALVLGVGAALAVRDQVRTGDQHSSINQRVDIEAIARDLWRTSPLTGVGLKFFKDPQYGGVSQPNVIVDEALAESGLIGAAGLIVFMGGSLVLLRRMDRSELAVAALAVTAARFTHGFADIYWVAGVTSLPWLIVGMALGRHPEESTVRRREVNQSMS